MTTKCSTCREEYSPACDWRQGRCPNHPTMIDQLLHDPYKARFYNLSQFIKALFKGK